MGESALTALISIGIIATYLILATITARIVFVKSLGEAPRYLRAAPRYGNTQGGKTERYADALFYSIVTLMFFPLALIVLLVVGIVKGLGRVFSGLLLGPTPYEKRVRALEEQGHKLREQEKLEEEYEL